MKKAIRRRGVPQEILSQLQLPLSELIRQTLLDTVITSGTKGLSAPEVRSSRRLLVSDDRDWDDTFRDDPSACAADYQGWRPGCRGGTGDSDRLGGNCTGS